MNGLIPIVLFLGAHGVVNLFMPGDLLYKCLVLEIIFGNKH